MRGEEKPE